MQLCPPQAIQVSPPLAAPRGWVGSAFGMRLGSHGQPDLHTGIDIGAPRSWPVLAVLPGRVIAAAPTGSPGFSRYGSTVVIAHPTETWEGRPLVTLSGHLESFAPAVRAGVDVTAGQLIGAVGNTAGTPEQPWLTTTSPHLHFEFLDRWPPRGRDLDRLDPTPIFEMWGIVAEARHAIRIVRGSRADVAAGCLSRANGPAPAPADGSSSELMWLLLALAFGGGDLF